MKKGEVAFPITIQKMVDSSHLTKGLTKYEYFLAKILQGLASNPSIEANVTYEGLAIAAIRQCDALFEELEKNE